MATDIQTTPGRRRRRGPGRALAIGGIVVSLLGAGTVLALGADFGTGNVDPAAATTGPLETTTVTRTTLVDTVAKDGTLGYGRTWSVHPKLNGTVTWLPDTGARITRGKPLYKVDNQPVVLLYGAIPAYRTLAEDVEGDDVKQLEQNLSALGYKGFTVDTEYTSSTAEAVKEWQEDLGLTETGTVEPGRIYYAPGEMRVSAAPASVGDPAGQGQSVLTLTNLSRVVTVELETREQRLARTGASVPVELPDGRTVTGKISKVSTVVETEQNGDASTKIELTVALTDQKLADGYEEASVRVSLTADERKNVLTVPVGALVALAEGGYGLQVVEGTTTRYVAVETGLFASGRVEVTGADLSEGLTVGMPS
jgi:peptidoglycan hydrolase-like protein with peptidoglycan-binding domain